MDDTQCLSFLADTKSNKITLNLCFERKEEEEIGGMHQLVGRALLGYTSFDDPIRHLLLITFYHPRRREEFSHSFIDHKKIY
jgi:hypothetical protein